MATNNLREALEAAQLTPDHLADVLGVDIRTVRRWLSGMPPYPRRRAKIARALKLTEQAIWPDIPPSTETQPRDLLTGYASVESIGIPSTEALIHAAQKQIELLDQTSANDVLSDALIKCLIESAQKGVPVRIMVGEPTQQLALLLGQPGIELRVIEPEGHQSSYRYDDQMLITLPLAEDRDDPPVIRVRRKGSGGVFDRFAAHFEDSWQHGIPLTSEDHLRYYLAEEEAVPDRDGQPEGLHRRAAEPATGTPAPSPPAVPRRWPRRPADSQS